MWIRVEALEGKLAHLEPMVGRLSSTELDRDEGTG